MNTTIIILTIAVIYLWIVGGCVALDLAQAVCKLQSPATISMPKTTPLAAKIVFVAVYPFLITRTLFDYFRRPRQ